MFDLRKHKGRTYEATVLIRLDIQVVTDGNITEEGIKVALRKRLQDDLNNMTKTVDDWVISNITLEEE